MFGLRLGLTMALGSVNSVSWAPHEYGLVLAAGSSDGKVSILTWKSMPPFRFGISFVKDSNPLLVVQNKQVKGHGTLTFFPPTLWV